MINRQLYVMKFNSTKLRELDYTFETTFNVAFALNEIIAISDNQMLRSIREIRKRTISRDKIERLYKERDALRKRCEKKKHNPAYAERIRWLTNKINRTMFMPDYISIVMDHPKHYNKIYERGITINGQRYIRFSCSAGQARVSTVIFVSEDIAEPLREKLNNGRDQTKKLAASKFNAYFGCYTSGTHVLTPPRIAIVPDYENVVKYKANFDTETDWDLDDNVEEREVEASMNRVDGQGLVSPEMAAQWGRDLELDYIPAEFIIRQAFLKGMVCVFPIHEFCEEVNGGNYLADTVYRDQNGNRKKIDLREVDLIVTESQFKLWDSYKSAEDYRAQYEANHLNWGTTSFTPKRLKDVLTLNYQFIQTLNLDEAAITDLCSTFKDWVTGVSYDKPEYMLLFLLGANVSDESIQRFLRSGDKWWVKALIVNPKAKDDPFIRRQIREMVSNRVKRACMGEIIVPGNFQTMVTDPYAFMQHVCGLPVTGLLKEGEYYCHYWNERGVKRVNTARSPQTYRCENVVADLVMNELTEKWYRYLYAGFVVNWYGHECVNWGGADYDGDILASTPCKAIIDGVYQDELTVTYDAPKPKKINFTDIDLFNADMFGFGSQIGAITNKGTTAYALLPILEKQYGKDSEEVKITISRLRQCCVAQSKQIDKTKIGQKVKGIPKAWTTYHHIEDGDTEEIIAYKNLMNRILLDKHPYFFRYRYADDNKAFTAYHKEKDSACRAKFGIGIDQLLLLDNKNEDQERWARDYYCYCPLIISDSPMNLLCKHMEGFKADILKKVRETDFDWTLYLDSEVEVTEDDRAAIVSCYQRHLRDVRGQSHEGLTETESYQRDLQLLKEKLWFTHSNPRVVANVLLQYVYQDKPSASKKVVWDLCGKYFVKAARKNNPDPIYIPVEDQDGDIAYCGTKYRMKEYDYEQDL